MARVFLVIIGFLIAQNAWGCAVCGFGDDGTREAFLFTTALLTLIPLIMIGGGVYYLTRVARRAERDFESIPQTDTP